MLTASILACGLFAALLVQAYLPQYTVVAFAAGLVMGFLGVPPVFLVLLAAAIVDQETMRIPNVYSILAALLALGSWATSGFAMWALAVSVSVGIFALILYAFGGIGGGDVKLLPSAALGILPSGPEAVLAASVLLLLAGIWLVLLHVTGRGVRRTEPMAPGIFLGAGAAWLIPWTMLPQG